MDFDTVCRKVTGLQENIEQVMVGQHNVVRLAVTCLLAEGHILIEDVPGVGKSMLAKTIARSISASTKRIQFTPDLLPSDVTGSNIYNPKDHSFSFRPGPIFGNIILADEINRTTPRTQSSLLEAMEESQVTVDGHTHPLPSPFFVIGTQNPIEFEGTYPLPISQLDRFVMKTGFARLDKQDEIRMIKERRESAPIDRIQPVLTPEEVCLAQRAVCAIRVDESLYGYVVDLVSSTRTCEQLSLGASPRTTLRLLRAAQATALMNGRDYMIPDDIRAVAHPVLRHRVIARTPVQYKGHSADTVLGELLNRIPVPY